VRPVWRWFASDEDRRAIDADLAELYELKRRADGDEAARRWLARQHWIYTWHTIAGGLMALRPRGITMQHLWRDLRFGVRGFLRAPALFATIIVTVGVGLGATTAMVGVVRAVLVSALPYADPSSLFWIYTDHPPFWFPFSVVDYRALEADHPAFAGVAGYQTRSATVSGSGEAERVTMRLVTGSYFPVLRQSPAFGRLLTPADDQSGEKVVVLTSGYWHRRFGADPAVVGRAMTIDGVSHTIVGVLQPTTGPLEHDIALFAPARWPQPTRKGPFFIRVLGRLRPDVSRAAALETLHATDARLFPLWQSSYQDKKATWGMKDLKTQAMGDAATPLLVVLAAVACVLLIACANAVNLLVARALDRGRELAIRGALGASRGRLLQQLLAETSALTLFAAAVGVAVAVAGIEVVRAYGGDYLPRVDEVHFGIVEAACLGLLAAISGVVIGLVPAIHSSRLRIGGALAAGGRSASDAPAARRLRRVLVAAEFALATPLIVAAVLVGASLNRLSTVDVGIDPGRLLTGNISLPAVRYPEQDGRQAFWDRAIERVRSLPGVEAAALADSRPPNEAGNQNNFDLEDHPALPGRNQPICTWVGVSPEFFATVGLRLERGRLLDTHSADDNVVVVDRAWADRFFPGEEVLGRRFKEGGCTTCDWTVVVGVVGNVKWAGLDAREDGTVYAPLVGPSSAFLVVRTAGAPATLAPSLRQAVRSLDTQLALSGVMTGIDLVSDSLSQPRYLTVVIGMFAVTALVLAIIGVYGVMAHFVQQHARDIGIRLALGGDPARVRRMVVGQGLTFVGAGVVAGIAAALLASRLLAALLFGVSATDIRTIVGVPAALTLVAIVACSIPARRAARVDPAQILRES
jgi:putative ABC transport system permease protein